MSMTCESATLSAMRAQASATAAIANHLTPKTGIRGPACSRGRIPDQIIRTKTYPSTG